MKNFRVIWLLLLGIALSEANAQIADDFFGYLPVRSDGKAGLITKSGSIVLNPKFDNIYPFDGKKYIKTEDKELFGLLDSSLKTVLAPIYKELRFVNDDIVFAVSSGLCCLIDLKTSKVTNIGDSVTDVRFLSADLYSVKKNGRFSVVKLNGKSLKGDDWEDIKMLFGNICAGKNSKYGLFSPDGKEILPVMYLSVTAIGTIALSVREDQGIKIADTAGVFLNGDYWDEVRAEGFCIRLRRETSVGLFSVAVGKMIIEPGQYSDFKLFSEGLYLVELNGKKGLVTSMGILVVPVKADEINFFENGYLIVDIGSKKGIYSLQGKKIIDCKHDIIIKDESFFVSSDDNIYTIYSISGKELWSGTPDDFFFKGRTAKIYQGDKITLINVKTDGEEQAREIFEEVGRINVDKNFTNINRLFSNSNNQSGFRRAQTDGNWFFNDSLNRWGLKNNKDSVLIKPSFIRIYRNLVNDSMVVVMKRTVIENNTFNRYGVVNERTGKYVTPLMIYDIITSDFDSKSYARCLLKDNKYAMLHKNGRLGKSRYAYISDSKEGFALFNLGGVSTKKIGDGRWDANSINSFEVYLKDYIRNGKWGYIADDSEIKIDAQFSYAERFIGNTAIVSKNGFVGVITPDSVLVDFKYNDIQRLRNAVDSFFLLRKYSREYGLSDEKGKYKTDCVYDMLENFSENRLVFYKNSFFGYMDTKGREVINADFTRAEPFSEGLAAVSNGSKYGFIDTLGNLVIDFNFKKPGKFYEQVCVVQKGAGSNYINSNGDFLNTTPYRKCYDFKNGRGLVILQGKYGAIDKNGVEVIKPKYNDLSEFDADGLARFKLKEKYGIIDKDGNIVIPARFDRLGLPSEGLVRFTKDNLTGFMTYDKKVRIPATFKYAADFKESRAIIKDKSLFGYIDTSGIIVIPMVFSKTEDFNHGCAVVKSKQWGLINHKGDTIIPLVYSKISRVKDTLFLVESIDSTFLFDRFGRKLTGVDGDYSITGISEKLLVLYKYRVGYLAISFNGDEIYKLNYSELTWIGEKYFRYQSMSNNGLADNKGNIIVEPEFEKIEWFGDNIFKISKGENFGYLTKEKTWIWKPGQ